MAKSGPSKPQLQLEQMQVSVARAFGCEVHAKAVGRIGSPNDGGARGAKMILGGAETVQLGSCGSSSTEEKRVFAS